MCLSVVYTYVYICVRECFVIYIYIYCVLQVAQDVANYNKAQFSWSLHRYLVTHLYIPPTPSSSRTIII